jgi:hypothetical protein
MRPEVACIRIAWVDIRTEDVTCRRGGRGDSTLQYPLSLLRLLLLALVSRHEEDVEPWLGFFAATALHLVFGVVSRL